MFDWFLVASFIVLVPFVVGIFNVKYINASFMPLLVNLGIAVVAEIFANIFRITIRNNQYVYNVFMILDFVTFFWLFNNWGAFNKIKHVYRKAIVFLFFTIWCLDNFYLNTLGNMNIVFKIVYSVFLVLVAIDQLKTIIIKSNLSIKQNPFFYICVAIIFYYTYSVFISLLISADLNKGHSKHFWERMWLIYVLFNVICNLLFTTAFIWIRKKVKFI